MGIYLEDNANGTILPLEITAQAPTTVSGTAYANCTIEPFTSDDTEGEGWIYIKKTLTNADSDFLFPINFLPTLP